MTAKRSDRRVKDILSKELVAVSSEDTIDEAIGLMTENGVTSLPVLDSHGNCIGILSAADLIQMSGELQNVLRGLDNFADVTHQWLLDKVDEHDMARRTVGEIMTREVATIGPEKLLTEAANAMLRHRVHHLPVVDHTGHMLGIISTMDLLAAWV